MLNQEYLEKLITDKIEENLNLDYKAAASLGRTDGKVKELSKDVSAFANSAGGTIIYGLKEDAVNKHLPSEIDPIDRKVISKEWIEQILNGHIQPRIGGIVITPIEIEGDVNSVVYHVEIPKSTTAHQANDKKYYKRFNFNSEPMYDYEVRDIFNRVKNPIIAIEFEVLVRYDGQHEEYELKVSARNKGEVLANYINCYVTIPNECLVSEYDEFGEGSSQLFGENIKRDVISYHPTLTKGPSRYIPILPKMSKLLSFKKILLAPKYDKLSHSLSWIVYADNTEPIRGEALLSTIEVNWEIP